MTEGRLIAGVGPSGVGKDSVMQGVAEVMPQLHLVRRVITRAPGLGGEDYDAVSEAQFPTALPTSRAKRCRPVRMHSPTSSS